MNPVSQSDGSIQVWLDIWVRQPYIAQNSSSCWNRHFLDIETSIRKEVMKKGSDKVNAEHTHNTICSPFIVMPPCQRPSNILTEMNTSTIFVVKYL